jgi:acetyl-CoA carboxylase biotin carboxyl carrier protein
MIGTFYHASEPNTEAFVKVGDQVSEGDTLCIIEAMKMMNQIESDINGMIERILVQNGDPVEYDQVLFQINPD